MEPVEEGKVQLTTATDIVGESPRTCIIPDMLEMDGKRESGTGTKLSPICIDEEMKLQATPVAYLKKLVFPKNFSLIEVQPDDVPGLTTASFSSRSTTQTKQSMYSLSTTGSDDDVGLTRLMKKSSSINSDIASLTVSRHGRAGQRWIVDPKTNQVIRLVSGCVPILKGGKILMVSSNKRNEWILPKGGWEYDEDIEESAIRETFEEAGVIGILGPKLSEVQYETRKAKEKRIALDENLKQKTESEGGQFSSGWSDVSQLSEDEHLFEKDHFSKSQRYVDSSLDVPKKPQVQVTIQSSPLGKGIDHMSPAGIAIVPSDEQVHPKDHVTSETPLEYNYVRVNMFPLFIQEVKSEWPESGRLRRAVDIDEAIELLAGRPEQQTMVLEVKEKEMHNV